MTKNSKIKYPQKVKIINLFLIIFSVSCFISLLVWKIYPSYFYDPGKSKDTPEVFLELNNEELLKYNGFDPDLPIYMGYEGKIYDVTSGKNYYGKGATYNYLVGKDSTKELNEVGVGEIIVRKYPAIGKLKD